MGSLMAVLIIRKNDSADVCTAPLSYWYLIELCSLAFKMFWLVWVLLLDGHLSLKLWNMINFITGEVCSFMHVEPNDTNTLCTESVVWKEIVIKQGTRTYKFHWLIAPEALHRLHSVRLWFNQFI